VRVYYGRFLAECIRLERLYSETGLQAVEYLPMVAATLAKDATMYTDHVAAFAAATEAMEAIRAIPVTAQNSDLKLAIHSQYDKLTRDYNDVMAWNISQLRRFGREQASRANYEDKIV
jgi:hypothetical protein